MGAGAVRAVLPPSGRQPPPITNHQPPMTDRSPASLPERSGRVRGGRASPGALIVLPFRRSRPAPRSRFPRALRLAALASGLTGSPPMTLLPSARGGHETAARTGSARRAGAGHPSTSARTPGVSFPRASSLDHSPPTSGRWIRRPPHRRDGRSLTRAPARMVCDAVIFERRAKSEGWRREIC